MIQERFPYVFDKPKTNFSVALTHPVLVPSPAISQGVFVDSDGPTVEIAININDSIPACFVWIFGLAFRTQSPL